jgi:hypothetical protein
MMPARGKYGNAHIPINLLKCVLLSPRTASRGDEWPSRF